MHVSAQNTSWRRKGCAYMCCPATRTSAKLDDIQSVDSHSYPPQEIKGTSWAGSASLAGYQQSIHARSSVAAVDYNRRTTGAARWVRTLWKKLEVGDIVLLRQNEQVPADVVVPSTSDPDNMCYLETKNLNGETNLKPRKSVEDVERASFVLESEPPHANLYLYHGILRYKDPSSGEQKQESVTINELLPRGCAIRDTAWIIGLVVFTGWFAMSAPEKRTRRTCAPRTSKPANANTKTSAEGRMEAMWLSPAGASARLQLPYTYRPCRISESSDIELCPPLFRLPSD